MSIEDEGFFPWLARLLLGRSWQTTLTISVGALFALVWPAVENLVAAGVYDRGAWAQAIGGALLMAGGRWAASTQALKQHVEQVAEVKKEGV